MTEIRNRIFTILRAIGRPGVESVINYLQNSSYFVRGCYGHHKEVGGLAKHSLEVYEHMLANADNIPVDSIIVVGLFHDLGKTAPRDGRGHGSRSVRILKQLGFHLTADESTAIWQHHNYDFDFRSHPLSKLLKSADCHSTRTWKEAHPDLCHHHNTHR